MVDEKHYNVVVDEISESDFNSVKNEYPSAVGHPDTARVLGVQYNRCNVSLKYGDMIVVAQLQGGRLPEGATTLPEGCSFKYFTILITPHE